MRQGTLDFGLQQGLRINPLFAIRCYCHYWFSEKRICQFGIYFRFLDGELQFCEVALPMSHLSCGLGAQPHDPEQSLLQLH